MPVQGPGTRSELLGDRSHAGSRRAPRDQDDQGRVDDALRVRTRAVPASRLGAEPMVARGRLGALVWLHPDHPTIESNTVC